MTTKNEKKTPLMEIRSLHVNIGPKQILKGIDLTINTGEVHAIMGPNGSGKSTLANVLAGRPEYTVTQGTVLYEGKDLITMLPEIRAREGIFLAFQYPVELPGVPNWQFVKTALDAVRTHHGGKEMDVRSFNKLWEEKMKLVEIDPALMKRSVNEGFSGGEKKRSEMLQMAVLDPKLALLDETDSGLDIDALRIIAQGVNQRRRPDNSILLVTHYQRLLNYIVPDFVHILIDGRIVKSGGKELALEVESTGYEKIKETAARG
ncbi:MAG: Fe-S cluster assembly ATPase SufC [Dehalococcoidia bacterium]|nr:Fe-S cluster assembly ATPase SufC [Dehalococcoidia bacterium]